MLVCLDALIDLIAMHRNVGRCRDPNAHLVAVDAENDDLDFVANADGFADAAGEDEHVFYSCMFSWHRAAARHLFLLIGGLLITSFGALAQQRR